MKNSCINIWYYFFFNKNVWLRRPVACAIIHLSESSGKKRIVENYQSKFFLIDLNINCLFYWPNKKYASPHIGIGMFCILGISSTASIFGKNGHRTDGIPSRAEFCTISCIYYNYVQIVQQHVCTHAGCWLSSLSNFCM